MSLQRELPLGIAHAVADALVHRRVGRQHLAVMLAGRGRRGQGVEGGGIQWLQIEVRDGKQVVVLKEATKDVLKALKPFERARPPKSFFDRAMEKAKELGTAGKAFIEKNFSLEKMINKTLETYEGVLK